jgi:hypothetical protein
MSRFNTSTKGTNVTTNLAGGKAYALDLKSRVVIGVLNSMLNEKQYYGSNTRNLVNDIKALIDVDAKFVANLAIYTRKEIHLRSITHILVSELAHHVTGKVYVRRVLNEIVERVDDMTEILAYYINTYGKPIPNSLKKGLRDAFWKFDAYGFAKYNRDGQVKIKDLVALVNPSPKVSGVIDTDRYSLINKIYNDTLEIPITWETQLSAKGNTKEVWESLIANRNLGYMATLRNLRNILNANVSNLDSVLDYLTNENAVKNSKQFPYRFFSAYREIKDLPNATSKVLDSVQKALQLSTGNLPKLHGTTFLTSDNSGSMENPVSEKSKVTMKDISCLMMATAHKYCYNAITSVFARDFKVVNVSGMNSIISNMQTFKNTNVGLQTQLHLSLRYLLDNLIKVDRIIVFSDEQCYGGSAQSVLDQYKKLVNPNVWIHVINLSGYGTTQFSKNSKTNLMAGWSDRMLEFINLAEKGEDGVTNTIETYYFK